MVRNKMKKRNPYEPIIQADLDVYKAPTLDDYKYLEIRFEDCTLEATDVHEFNTCVFKRVTFVGDFSKVSMIDCSFDHCDFSNTTMNESRFHRVIFNACKSIGISLDRCVWTYVTLNQCNLSYASISDSKWTDVRFNECSLAHSSLFAALLLHVNFQTVNLTHTDFSDTSLKDIDLSSCTIDGIRLSPHLLRGLIVNEHQAVALVSLLGIEVKE